LLYLFTRISRHDDGSLVHFFSSHFYTALVKDRPSGVTRWTEKKGIDIFEKKFIFVPINKTLHWSQCVVINPGAIVAHNKWQALEFDESKGFDLDAPFPCILFLDSLKAHQKEQVANNIRAWLNAEWKRLGKSDDPAVAPFTKKSMMVFSPKSKYSYSAPTRYSIDVSPHSLVATTVTLQSRTRITVGTAESLFVGTLMQFISFATAPFHTGRQILLPREAQIAFRNSLQRAPSFLSRCQTLHAFETK
jgi:hypothetical protein